MSLINMASGHTTTTGDISGLCREVLPGSFRVKDHFYPDVQDAQIHPLVLDFLRLGNEEMVRRHVARHPEINAGKLRNILAHKAKHFFWAGEYLSLLPVSPRRRSHTQAKNPKHVRGAR